MAYKYIIFNRTDGVTATPDTYSSKKKAEEKIASIREIFKRVQGFYTNNRRERMDPDDVIYEIVKVG